MRPDIPLPVLCDVLLAAMGWLNCHLHEFVVDGKPIGVPSDTEWKYVEDEARLRLDQTRPIVVAGSRSNMTFGDNWNHQVIVEKVLPLEPNGTYPRCTTGRRACPPEDIGGAPGYEQLLSAGGDKRYPEQAGRPLGRGSAFDAEAFNLDKVNAAIRRALVPSPDRPGLRRD